MKVSEDLNNSGDVSIFKIEISQFSDNETYSLIELPLPQYTFDSQNSSRTDILPLEHLKRPFFTSVLNSSFNQNLRSPLASTKKFSYLTESKTDTSKVFCKQRIGGLNLVNIVKKKTGNSYLARKEKYLKEIKKLEKNKQKLYNNE